VLGDAAQFSVAYSVSHDRCSMGSGLRALGSGKIPRSKSNDWIWMLSYLSPEP
jgi:hypothetical protein